MRAEHPDSQSVRSLIADLTSWLEFEAHDPTSAITGGGAVRVAERMFSALHSGRPAMLLPSATFAMRSALIAAGVQAGQRVLIPEIDWTSTLAAVREVGATPITIGVDPKTMTMNSEAVSHHLDEGVAAVVACHLHGVPADVPAIRDVVGSDIPIIEDCAQALGSSIDDRLVGTLGSDFAIFSFANKTLNVGEAAIVASANMELHHRLIELTGHPVRQTLEGIASPNIAAFSTRIAAACAMQLAVALKGWDRDESVARHAHLRACLGTTAAPSILGGDMRRQNAAAYIPMQAWGSYGSAANTTWTPSTAYQISSVINGRPLNADAMLVHWVRDFDQAARAGVHPAG